MVEIIFGAEAIRENPALISLINISSPRRPDDRMSEALTVYAKARQAVIITPFILTGAIAPVSVAGTLIQQNTGALAGIAYAQMVQPGTPVVYGSFKTNVNLKSNARLIPDTQRLGGTLLVPYSGRRASGYAGGGGAVRTEFLCQDRSQRPRRGGVSRISPGQQGGAGGW